MTDVLEYNASVLDDSGVLGLIDADFYAAFAQSLAKQSDFILVLVDTMNRGLGIFWGTGQEGDWRLQIRSGSTEATGFRSFTRPLSISSGNLVLAELGELLAGANDPLFFPPDLFAVPTHFPPGHYQCKVIQMYDPSNLADEPGLRAIDFLIGLERSEDAHNQVQIDQIPWTDSFA